MKFYAVGYTDGGANEKRLGPFDNISDARKSGIVEQGSTRRFSFAGVIDENGQWVVANAARVRNSKWVILYRDGGKEKIEASSHDAAKKIADEKSKASGRGYTSVIVDDGVDYDRWQFFNAKACNSMNPIVRKAMNAVAKNAAWSAERVEPGNEKELLSFHAEAFAKNPTRDRFERLARIIEGEASKGLLTKYYAPGNATSELMAAIREGREQVIGGKGSEVAKKIAGIVEGLRRIGTNSTNPVAKNATRARNAKFNVGDRVRIKNPNRQIGQDDGTYEVTLIRPDGMISIKAPSEKVGFAVRPEQLIANAARNASSSPFGFFVGEQVVIKKDPSNKKYRVKEITETGDIRLEGATPLFDASELDTANYAGPYRSRNYVVQKALNATRNADNDFVQYYADSYSYIPKVGEIYKYDGKRVKCTSVQKLQRGNDDRDRFLVEGRVVG